MDKPNEGLKAILNILNPQGFMKISLYSQPARKNVIKARQYIGKIIEDITI